MTKDDLALRTCNLVSAFRSGAITRDQLVEALRRDLGVFALGRLDAAPPTAPTPEPTTTFRRLLAAGGAEPLPLEPDR